MGDAPKLFSLEEANSLVATLELEFGRVARLRAELAPLIEKVGGADAAVAILHDGTSPSGPEAARCTGSTPSCPPARPVTARPTASSS